MRILFVVSSLNTGGAQRAVSNITVSLPDECEVDILLNSAKDIVYPYKGNLIDLSIAEPRDRKSALYQLKVLVKRCIALRKLKREGAYDACISFLESANVANILTGRKYCKTFVSVQIHLLKEKELVLRLLVFPQLKRLYNQASGVVPLSDGVRLMLARDFGIRDDLLTTIYNGFDFEYIRAQAGKRAPAGAFTFITVGRYTQQKGQWHLIRAFAQLAGKYDNCRLVMLGDGPYMAYFKKLISDYRLEGRVSLKGFVANPFAELINADAYVFPSLWEGFGNALIEAMACDLPVISTDYRSGAREILAPGTDIGFEQKAEIEFAEFGIITPVCSGIKHPSSERLEPQEQFLLEAMELLLTDEELRQKYCLAPKKRLQDFSIENSVKKWCALIAGGDGSQPPA